MRQRLLLAGVAALGLALSVAPTLAQNGNGKGPDGGRGQEARGGPDRGAPDVVPKAAVRSAAAPIGAARVATIADPVRRNAPIAADRLSASPRQRP
jgi:hypothetical protein